jgi:hypothetical protein
MMVADGAGAPGLAAKLPRNDNSTRRGQSSSTISAAAIRLLRNQLGFSTIELHLFLLRPSYTAVAAIAYHRREMSTNHRTRPPSVDD